MSVKVNFKSVSPSLNKVEFVICSLDVGEVVPIPKSPLDLIKESLNGDILIFSV